MSTPTHINPAQIAATDGSTDLAQQLMNMNLKPSVASAAVLPLTGNTVGDLRFAQAENQFYQWIGATPSWQVAGGGEQRGTAFPATGLYGGLLFYRTDLEMLYCYNETAQAWIQK